MLANINDLYDDIVNHFLNKSKHPSCLSFILLCGMRTIMGKNVFFICMHVVIIMFYLNIIVEFLKNFGVSEKLVKSLSEEKKTKQGGIFFVNLG